jgi:hypothetical protein
MKKILFVLACFLIIFSQLEAKDGKAGDIRELFSSSLTENEAAFMFLGFSGVVVRTSKRTIIIDPADMLKDEDLKALKEKGVDLVLFTHSLAAGCIQHGLRPQAKRCRGHTWLIESEQRF